MTDTPPDSRDTAVLDTALQMVVWEPPQRRQLAVLLKRFGTQENALAALVTTQLLAPARA